MYSEISAHISIQKSLLVMKVAVENVAVQNGDLQESDPLTL